MLDIDSIIHEASKRLDCEASGTVIPRSGVRRRIGRYGRPRFYGRCPTCGRMVEYYYHVARQAYISASHRPLVRDAALREAGE